MSKGAYLMGKMRPKGITPGMPFGGIPELTKTDIAACCSGLSDLIFHLLMAKYCNDTHSAIHALGPMQELTCEKSQVVADMDIYLRIAFCSYLIDDFAAAHRCKRCKGTALQVKDSKIIECERCKGTGKEESSSRARSAALGIPKSSWAETGLNRECEFFEQLLYDMEISALARIARKAS